MPDKPRKIAHQYACWRGTAEHLVETGAALEQEIRRACDAAKERAYGEIDASTKRMRDDYEQNLRAQTQLKSTEPLAPGLQAQLASLQVQSTALELSLANVERQRQTRAKFIENEATKITFGYSDRPNQFVSANSPTALGGLTKADQITMRGHVLGVGSNASITVTIQNKPWETVSLEIEGDDPDWVSSANAPLETMLERRQSPVVRFLRNQWTRGAIGLLMWVVFIPPIETLIVKLSLNRLMAVPLSLVPATLISAIYTASTRALVITSKEQSALAAIATASVPPLLGAIASFLLGLLGQRITGR